MTTIVIIVCAAIIAGTAIWAHGRMNALEERADELKQRQKELDNKAFELSVREETVSFREANAPEITAKYTITDADYNRGDKLMRAVNSRLAMQIGWNVIKRLGEPELTRDEEGRDIYVYKFRIKNMM